MHGELKPQRSTDFAHIGLIYIYMQGYDPNNEESNGKSNGIYYGYIRVVLLTSRDVQKKP